MTDPAIAYLPGQGYGTYDRGTELDVWLKAANGSSSLGVVWPGMSSSFFKTIAPFELETRRYCLSR